ncbi:RNA polymerase II C-terminal domain phosphatase-like 5 [Cardamine amara subsp. amara]|uniref:protein-serine/threonine phosphatase n=1 Tax=Cardamine amara subsp. amara TaxID=228776 RepID=A0ABD1A6M9_CARAN
MIDPNKIYFGDRVITRKESHDMKTLDLVLADERGTVIVDNAVEVWPHHKRNLVEITSYVYFRNDTRKKGSRLSYAERKTDESRCKRALVNLLKFLKEVHSEFSRCGFEEELDSKDFRSLINGPLKPHRC